jgi:Leucine-rich repeat (LRR) protein
VALSALRALEQRLTATSVNQLQLEPPPRPVPKRKQPFVLPPSLPPARPPPVAPETRIVLDGFVLLESARVEDPADAEKVVLEGCAISSVVADDLLFFTKMTHLDLGDNNVQVEQLAFLPALQELHLDCNGLSRLACPPAGFPRLEVLNLSFNCLVTPEELLELAKMPCLREIDLSHNDISALPADMSSFGTLEARARGEPGARERVGGGERVARARAVWVRCDRPRTAPRSG